MKHRFILPAAVAVAVLSLAACTPASVVSPSSGASAAPATSVPSPTAAAHVALPGVDPTAALADMKWVDNGSGSAPGLTFTYPINFTASGGRVIKDGTGAALKDGQILSLDVVQFSGDDGTVQNSTYKDGKAIPVTLSSSSLDPVLYGILSKAHIGAQVLFAVPDAGQGAVVVAFDVMGATDVLAKPTGATVAPVAGLPTVTLDGTGKPSVSFTGATKPTALVSQDLITGTGPAIAEGQSVTVNYTGWLWDGKQFDSSWDRGSTATFTIATGSLIDGWVKGMVGKTVGSQVLLVVPPALGYGAAGQGTTIPGDSTLVFVVDILAAN
ncbi:FKBP-type peptidyl-prolyl cis-trans isomerase [Demequina lutea]|uniref:peptidylprolyl isomerase n=1 Tax=Demequina lutea TaxID=431489 RepID=A0A7Z0CKZ2_9MICO|nr:FKBP-type peptidyl-prolyl cis-trans isomerase [Demequina lutea]NYI42347.1 peptidylprolyl isomerase [Demequina lutea]